MTQEQAFSILKTGGNVFLTGPAGSGKTFLLRKFITHLKNKKKSVSVTATTGLAATHLNGRTIHSWAGIGIQTEITANLIEKILSKKTLANDIRTTDVLIIDEISMLHDYRLDMVDQVCQVVKNEMDKPFGGLQVVLSGDFFQLPPVGRAGEETKFVVDSAAWKNLKPRICYLNEQYRQSKDNDLSEILNALRNNTLQYTHVEKLKSRQLENPGDLTELHCHNQDIDQINHGKLKALASVEHVFRGEKTDLSQDQKLAEQLVKNCLAPEELRLKVGALVMFIKNNPENGYINGTLGEVIGFNTANGFPLVKTKTGRVVHTDLVTWKIERDGLDLATFKQIPLKLAWAITIHKSQGMTLDGAFIDLSKTFEPGMGYVALSRLKNLESLYLKGFNAMALTMNPKALIIDQNLQKQSEVVFNE